MFWTTKALNLCLSRKEQTFEARITGGLQVLWEGCYGNEREHIKLYFACVCLYIRSEYRKCSKKRYVGSWGVCVWGSQLVGLSPRSQPTEASLRFINDLANDPNGRRAVLITSRETFVWPTLQCLFRNSTFDWLFFPLVLQFFLSFIIFLKIRVICIISLKG